MTKSGTAAATIDEAPLRRDAAENRSRLIAAAVDVFNDEGIDAGVELIAKRAGVGVGTLYRRFPTKEALIRHLVGEMLAEMTAAAVTAAELPDGRGLERFVRAAADQLAAHRGCLQRLWNREPEDLAALEQLRARIDDLVDDARRVGSVRAGITRADITAVMWSLQGVIDNAGEAGAETCSRLLDVVFAGLRPPA